MNNQNDKEKQGQYPLPHREGRGGSPIGYLNLFIQSIYASTLAAMISVLAPKP